MAERQNIKIGIVGNRLVPFNEAYANQMRVLSEELGAEVITCNDLGWIPFRKIGRCFVVNTKFLMKRTPVLSLINGLVFYIFLKLYERKFDTTILSAGVESRFLNYLNLKKCIPIISTIDDEAKAKKFASEIAPKLKKMIVQSRRVGDKLISYGVDSDKIHFIYPIVDLNKFRYTEPPSLNEFKILFASAPNVEIPSENNFEAKGVPLLLEAFKEFIKEEDAILYILWRGKYNKELFQKIDELNLENHLWVINEVVDMPEMYAKTHITAIPFLNLWRSPEIPSSALESLACGRPVVTTDVGEIAELVRKYKCGHVAKPSKDEFLVALKECKKNYETYKKNCRRTAESLFGMDAEKFKEGTKIWRNLDESKLNICVITHPFDNIAGETILENFIEILEPISNEIFVITGNFPEQFNKKNHIIRLKCINEKDSILKRISKFILTQRRISFNLFRERQCIDIVIFYIGARLYILPILVAKLLRKKVVVAATGSMAKIFEVSYGKKWFGIGIIFSRFVGALEKINFSLSDRIFVESESAIQFLELEGYRDKISISGTPYVDADLFKIEKDLENRRNLVGYIGRLVEQKGVINFVRALPIVLKERDDAEFLIGGAGPLFNEIIAELKRSGSLSTVEVTGVIPSNEFVGYLNELKLLVLPSYEEGLPGIVKQAMACGTPVLATSVGGIPDLIKDGETGFIMEDNSPECIVKNVIRALEHPNRDRIVKNARKLIEDEYTYEVLVEKCRNGLSDLMKA